MPKKGSGIFGSANEDVAKNLAKTIQDNLGKKKEGEPKTGCGTGISILLFLMIALPISYLWFGFVLMTLWNWFLPAIGLATINYGTAMGIIVLAGFFKIGLAVAKPNENVLKMSLLVVAINVMLTQWVAALSCLGIGWIIHFFA
jgi:hypothetical protein